MIPIVWETSCSLKITSTHLALLGRTLSVDTMTRGRAQMPIYYDSFNLYLAYYCVSYSCM